jgi:hypothetical protein
MAAEEEKMAATKHRRGRWSRGWWRKEVEKEKKKEKKGNSRC